MASFGAESKRGTKHGKVVYPSDHKLGMRVPQGGSNCAKCEYIDGKACKNRVFVRWNGSTTIPEPVDCYCCDMFETEKEKK